jgi:hypothetical protein
MNIRKVVRRPSILRYLIKKFAHLNDGNFIQKDFYKDPTWWENVASKWKKDRRRRK